MALKIKEEKMNIREPAKDEEIVATFENIHMVDVNISAEQLRKEDLKDMKTHCHCTPYIFQVKKCLNSDCSYCMNHPIQITPDQFASLHFLPLPLLATSKAGYLSFEELYGKLPSDTDRPSATPTFSSEAAEVDAMHKTLFNNAKVRQVIFCGECFKPRCIFAISKLRKEEEIVVERVKEAKTYSCGSPLFPPDSPLHVTIIVRCCADPVEGVYYTATLKIFPPVCFYCGMAEGFVTEGIVELQRQYAVVRPLYFLCQSEGKTHKVGRPNNVVKRQRTHL